MGVESYLLRLNGGCPLHNVESNLQSIGHVERDEWPHRAIHGEIYYVFKDGTHVIEFELCSAPDGLDTEVNMRFAICHPNSIDKVFTDIAIALMSGLGLSASMCEDVPNGVQREFAPQQSSSFTACCLWSIANARGRWQRQFGMEQMGVSVDQACKYFFFDRLGESESPP